MYLLVFCLFSNRSIDQVRQVVLRGRVTSFSSNLRPLIAFLYTVPTVLNGVRKQTAEPRSANFCKHIHVDKVCSPANFHQNRQRP